MIVSNFAFCMAKRIVGGIVFYKLISSCLTPYFFTILLNPCPAFSDSVDPDQLGSEEAN